MGISLIPLTYTVKNGCGDKFYVACIHSATIKNNSLKIHLSLHLKLPPPPLSLFLPANSAPQMYSNNKHRWHSCGEWTDGWGLAAGSSQEEPLSGKQMAGCSQTHGSQKFHAVVYSKEQVIMSGKAVDMEVCVAAVKIPAVGTGLSMAGH